MLRLNIDENGVYGFHSMTLKKVDFINNIISNNAKMLVLETLVKMCSRFSNYGMVTVICN